MSTGFVGSRSIDERRRRRLASESAESLDDADDELTSHNIARTHRFAAGQFPLRTIVFPRRWKLSCYYLPLFLCFAGLIAADLYRSEFTVPDSALFHYFSLETSPLPQYVCGGVLFLSGQIALLIAALRTQSLHDFSGRYRLWKWIAAGLFLFALCCTTQFHHVWASTVIEQRLFDWGPQTELLAWLVPALGIGLTVSVMAYLEMRGDRAGLNFTILAAAAYVVRLTFMLTQNMVPWDAYHHLISAGIMYFAHWCLLTSLLLHVHHLLYRSIDLPEKAPSRVKQICHNYLHRRRLKRKARNVAKAIRRKELLAEKAQQREEVEAKSAADPVAVPETQAEVAASTKPQSKPSPKKATPQPDKVAPQKPVAAEQIEEPAPQASSKKTRQKAKPQAKSKNVRVDSPHDPELLKGLSKRERRKLQKQWREEERRLAAESEEDYA